MNCRTCKRVTHNRVGVCDHCLRRRDRKEIRQPCRPIPLNTPLCNCAGCAVVCLGDSRAEWYDLLTDEERASYPAPVRGRINGRPYCGACLRTKEDDRAEAS